MISNVYLHHLTAVDDEIDEMDHVNNLVYLRWTLRAAVAHSASVGWTSARYRECGSGFIVRSHNIKYRRPAVLRDEITVRTWIADMERVSSVRKYEIVRTSDDIVLARAETNWVFVNLATLELQRILPEIRDAFGLGEA